LGALINQEMARIVEGTAEPAQMAQLLQNQPKPVSLSDTTIPLHLRLIERKHAAYLALVSWGRTIDHCDNLEFNLTTLVDPANRKSMQAVNACREADLNGLETGLHQLNKAPSRSQRRCSPSYWPTYWSEASEVRCSERISWNGGSPTRTSAPWLQTSPPAQVFAPA
jgi:hypothetical protein